MPLLRTRWMVALLLVATAWPRAGSAQETSQPSRVVAEIHRIERLKMMDQGRELRAFIESLTPAELQELRAFAESDRTLMVTDHIWPTLLRVWGLTDGPAALACAQSRRTANRPSLESAALTGWATYAPQAAWDRILLLSNRGADKRYLTTNVLAVIAEDDTSLALRMYPDLVSEHACLACHASILVGIAMKQGRIDSIRAHLAAMPPGPARSGMLEAYWEMLGTFMQKDAVPELDAVVDPAERTTAEIKLCAGWAERDPVGCFDYIFTHPDPRRAEALILPAIDTWAHGAVAEDVARLVKRLPSDLAQRSLQGISGRLARIDPVATLDWLASFPDTEVRTDGLASAMWNWTLSDSEPALAYLHQTKDTEIRGILVWNYLRARVRNKALQPAELAEIEYGFAKDWVRRLLSTLAADLSNPKINDTNFFDTAAFVAFVKQTPAVQDSDRARVLESLRIAPPPR